MVGLPIYPNPSANSGSLNRRNIMERPRKINFPFLMLTLLFLLTQTAFALSSTLSYDEMNGNVQGNQTKEEITLSIENAKTNAIDYLITEKNYPISLMANEVGIKLNSLTRRCDTVVYNKQLEPLMIIEYKESKTTVTQHTFDQIVRYNNVLRVPYIVVSNGITHYCCKIDYTNQSYEFIIEIPNYNNLI